jgi:SAM-dependent methyltransferase
MPLVGPRYDLAQSAVHKRQAVEFHLAFLKSLGLPIPPGARVLDFGCGAGHTVDVLLQMGFDAYGCDVREWWGNDQNRLRDEYGVTYVAPPHVVSRLRCIDDAGDTRPLGDERFDLCISDQVMEHVFNHARGFRQIVDLLKPDGLSLHRFPGPNMLFEGHVHLPFPALCHNKAYLAAWALTGRRSHWQGGMSWQEALHSNVQIMETVNYRSKTYLGECARQAHANISFHETDEMRLRDVGRAAKLVRRTKRFGIDSLVAGILSKFAQRYMILTRASD